MAIGGYTVALIVIAVSIGFYIFFDISHLSQEGKELPCTTYKADGSLKAMF